MTSMLTLTSFLLAIFGSTNSNPQNGIHQTTTPQSLATSILSSETEELSSEIMKQHMEYQKSKSSKLDVLQLPSPAKRYDNFKLSTTKSTLIGSEIYTKRHINSFPLDHTSSPEHPVTFFVEENRENGKQTVNSEFWSNKSPFQTISNSSKEYEYSGKLDYKFHDFFKSKESSNAVQKYNLQNTVITNDEMMLHSQNTRKFSTEKPVNFKTLNEGEFQDNLKLSFDSVGSSVSVYKPSINFENVGKKLGDQRSRSKSTTVDDVTTLVDLLSKERNVEETLQFPLSEGPFLREGPNVLDYSVTNRYVEQTDDLSPTTHPGFVTSKILTKTYLSTKSSSSNTQDSLSSHFKASDNFKASETKAVIGDSKTFRKRSLNDTLNDKYPLQWSPNSKLNSAMMGDDGDSSRREVKVGSTSLDKVQKRKGGAGVKPIPQDLEASPTFPVSVAIEDEKFKISKSDVSATEVPQIMKTISSHPFDYSLASATDKSNAGLEAMNFNVGSSVNITGSVKLSPDVEKLTPKPRPSDLNYSSPPIKSGTPSGLKATRERNLPSKGVPDETTRTASSQLTWEPTTVTAPRGATPPFTQAVVRNHTDDKYGVRRPRLHEILTITKNDSIISNRTIYPKPSQFGKVRYLKPSNVISNQTTTISISDNNRQTLTPPPTSPNLVIATPTPLETAPTTSEVVEVPTVADIRKESLLHPNESMGKLNQEIPWPVKKEAIVEGDIILGGLMMVHEREDSITCGPIMPQGGVQALEAMLFTLDQLNFSLEPLLPNITLGAHILDDCDKDTYGLEMAVDFIKDIFLVQSPPVLPPPENSQITNTYKYTGLNGE